jgi:hypothetical protein
MNITLTIQGKEFVCLTKRQYEAIVEALELVSDPKHWQRVQTAAEDGFVWHGDLDPIGEVLHALRDDDPQDEVKPEQSYPYLISANDIIQARQEAINLNLPKGEWEFVPLVPLLLRRHVLQGRRYPASEGYKLIGYFSCWERALLIEKSLPAEPEQ